jgi:hypothetical protein
MPNRMNMKIKNAITFASAGKASINDYTSRFIAMHVNDSTYKELH